MIVMFDIDLEAVIQELHIEAKSVEEAKEILLNMKLSELAEEGFVDDFEIKTVDMQIEETTQKVKLSQVKYHIDSLDDEDLDISEIESLLEGAEIEVNTYDYKDVDSFIDDAIEMYIFEKLGLNYYGDLTYDYEVLEVY